MKEYVIGIDIGTTCTKVVVIDAEGNIAGQGSKGYSLLTNGPCVEQKAEDWIKATQDAISQAICSIDSGAIRGISCSTQGGSTVAVRADGSFVSNAWTWMDRRSTKQVSDLTGQLGSDYIYRATGSRPSPSLDAAKIPNMKSCESYEDTAYYWTTLEVINHYLTGNAFIDPSNAAMRQLLNIDKIQWDEKILHAAGISEKELPRILPAGALVGYVTQDVSAATGLPAGIPVYNGAHDQYCASLGAGAIHGGDMLLSAGTTWVLMGITEKPMYTDSYIVPGRHPIPGLYGAIASLVGSGASMEWFKNHFMSADFDKMNEVVPDRMDSTKDLFFYPYVNGAPYPIHNSSAKGVFAGITLQHDQFDLARALMEGVAFGVRRGAEDFQNNGSRILSITMMGGASKSDVWMQMIASITRIPIRRLNCADVCAVGAAMIAGCGANMFRDFADAADKIVSVRQVFHPIESETQYYQDKFEKFDRLWSVLSTYYKGE